MNFTLKMLQTIISPWHYIYDPLVQEEIKSTHLRAKPRYWILILIVCITLLGVLVYLYQDLAPFSNNVSTYRRVEIVTHVTIILGIGLGVASAFLHLNLLFTIISHSVGLRANEQKLRDWVTTNSTMINAHAWTQIQFAILGWQVLPLTYLLLLTHAIFALGGLVFLSITLAVDKYGVNVLPSEIYIYVIVLCILSLLMPIVEIGIFISSNLVGSSYIQRRFLLMLVTFFRIYLKQSFRITLLLFIGFFISFLAFTILFQVDEQLSGLGEGHGTAQDFAELFVVLYVIIVFITIVIGGLFFDWYPIFAFFHSLVLYNLGDITKRTAIERVVASLIIVVAWGLPYILASLMVIRNVEKSVVIMDHQLGEGHQQK